MLGQESHTHAASCCNFKVRMMVFHGWHKQQITIRKNKSSSVMLNIGSGNMHMDTSGVHSNSYIYHQLSYS